MKFTKAQIFRILKVCLLVFFVFLTGSMLVSRSNRNLLKTYFSTSCKDYKQSVYSRKLRDKIIEYSDQARIQGLRECKDEAEIRGKISDCKLFRIRSCRQYIIERMSYSYPCLTKESKTLLDEIGKRFREKTDNAGLSRVRFIVTSMTRTTEKMKGLKRNNHNASLNSPHLNGNAFDISYIRFSCRKLFVTPCDKKFLKEALAQVIWELREEGKCWATYEKVQSCFHVVSR
jgi:hypothetical protein